MIKNVKAILAVFLIVTMRLTLNAEGYKVPDYELYANEIVNTFALEMKQELDLHCDGDGGSMPRDVEKIDVLFSVNRRATIEEARELEVKAVDRLLQIINAHEKIRPYLREYPFTPSRVCVTISFGDKLHDYFTDGTVTFMALAKGKIFYRSYDPILNQTTALYEEPYETARGIVQTGLNRKGDIRIHQPTPYEAHMDKVFNDFAKEAKKKWGLEALRQGGKLVSGIEEIAVHFTSSRRTSVEQARKLEVAITERLLDIVNNDEVLPPYLKEYPLQPDRIKVAITVRKRPFQYYRDGSVTWVRPKDGKLVYLAMRPERDGVRPITPDQLLCEESYEEAKRALNPMK